MTQTQEKYNAHEHLIKIKGKDGTIKDYLPANWRLYELRYRYPNITIESEIIHLDVEKNFVIVKAIIFDGETYEKATRRASSMKQGFLSALDKVETAAKARAARDFGVSTELALDSEPEEDLEAPQEPQKPLGKKASVTVLPVPGQGNGHQEKISAQQAATIRKLCTHLGKPIPDRIEAYSFEEAKELFEQLSKEYKEVRDQQNAR